MLNVRSDIGYDFELHAPDDNPDVVQLVIVPSTTKNTVIPKIKESIVNIYFSESKKKL